MTRRQTDGSPATGHETPGFGQRVPPGLRVLLACAAIAVVAIGNTACGGGGASSPTRAAAPSERDGDSDVDRLTRSAYDYDNDAIPEFGQPAGVADRRAILALIKRYYASAAARDGARACSMLDTRVAESVVEEHHRGKGPTSLQDNSCAEIMSRLFEQRHRVLSEGVRAYRVLVVQRRRNRGYALVRFSARHELREVQVLVRFERGAWMMDVPLDNGAQ